MAVGVTVVGRAQQSPSTPDWYCTPAQRCQFENRGYSTEVIYSGSTQLEVVEQPENLQVLLLLLLFVRENEGC